MASDQVTFFDTKGKQLLIEEMRGNFLPVTADPIELAADSFALLQEFNRGSDEGFFVLAQQNNDEVNYADKNVKLTTHNLVISIPFLA